MRVPNVPERMKEAPAHALRAVFAGIGQALLVSDRMRRRFRDGGPEPSAVQPVNGPPSAPARPAPARPAAPATTAAKPSPAPGPAPAAPAASTAPAAAPAPPAPAPGPAPAAAAKPGTAAKPSTAAQPAGAAKAAAVKPAAAKPGAAKPAAAGSGAAAAAGPPLPNYDDLTIASLRARMRGLDVSQLRGLISYEQAHAARGDVIAMFERRIAKIRETGG